MKFFKSLHIVIYTLIFLAIGGILVALSLNLIPSSEVVDAVNYIYTDYNVKMALGIIGGIIILSSLVVANRNLGMMQTEKTIAFENPEGEVTVSLSAIEDFIKKSVGRLPEVKELKSVVTANKKGINIGCKAIIFANTNIPETTERIQSVIKSKVHEMLGVEEKINIKVHVTKISVDEKGQTTKQPKESEGTSRRMPFGE